MSRADPAIHATELPGPQIAMLTRLAEIGMEIAEAAGRMALAQAEAAEAGPQGLDPGLTYTRVARAVRLTIALQSRLAGALAVSRRAEAVQRRSRIHLRIEQVIEAERDDQDRADQLSSQVWERLTDLDDADLLDRPIQEVVARICADLGLPPDWAAAAFWPASPTPSVGGVYPRADLWPDPGAAASPASQATEGAAHPPRRMSG